MDARSLTLTVLFTDIEGSTRLWEQHPDAMRVALARHDVLVRRAIEDHGGHVFKMVGDAFHAVFTSATDALDAAITGQRVLGTERWPADATITARMALHVGECTEVEGDYVGPMLNRLSRMLGTAHGGQLVLSQGVADLVQSELPDGVSLMDLGEHRLRDLSVPLRIFQVRAAGMATDFAPLKSLEDPGLPNNLPAQVTTFVGRDDEIAQVRNLLDDARVVTVTGAGGVGKTRLALQVAADLLDGSGDGVWLVELAPIVDPDHVAAKIASVLHVAEEPGRDMVESLVDALRDRAVLIVLDNCEHVLDTAAKITERLVHGCPEVEVLATSREPLGITGEHVYRVPPLTFPPPTATAQDVGSVASYEAVQLFAERATHHRPDFVLDPSNVDAVVSVCRQLDGIPLAIELAAARLRALSIGEIAARLDERFTLLRGGSRTALPRQQTLAALVGWSYDLLLERERIALCRTSVFVGGWDLEAAEAVVADGEHIEPSEVLDLLGALVDKSLVQAEPRADSTRYGLLETIRQYAMERLATRDAELVETRQRHRDHYLTMAEQAAPQLFGINQADWYDRLTREHGNLRAALTTTRADPDGAEKGLRFVAALVDFWGHRGHAAEGAEQARIALARPDAAPPTRERAAALGALADLLLDLGENVEADGAANEALVIARGLGDVGLTAGSLYTLGYSLFLRRDFDAARRVGDEALGLARQSGDPHCIGYCLNLMAHVVYHGGDGHGARALVARSRWKYGAPWATTLRRTTCSRTSQCSRLTRATSTPHVRSSRRRQPISDNSATTGASHSRSTTSESCRSVGTSATRRGGISPRR